jgi:hypothetical protein
LRVFKAQANKDNCIDEPSNPKLIFPIWYSIEPFVIGPGQIVIKSLTLPAAVPDFEKEEILPDRANARALISDSQIPAEDEFGILACLGFTISTPDSADEIVLRPLFTTRVGKTIIASAEFPLNSRKPMTLVQRRKAALSW